ncbi:MAG: FAD-dependent oxidoreductase [Alphaproteobacteria bacterium]|nr:FAD-dependent oxidoreductase [Alphaproteobacteria bacterium]
MAETESIAIIGAGHAGGRAAEAMRQAGFGGGIVLIGEEAHPPYERPPLSKELLTGEDGVEKTFLNPAAFYAENGIELRLGTRAEAIDRDARRVVLADGGAVAYDKVLIATGGRVRTLDCPGSALAGIHYLRVIDDTLALRAALGEGVRVVVIGGGFIGLEVAASARLRGAEVTVVELADQVLARVADPAVGALVARLHEERGVHIRTGASVERIAGNGRVAEVVATDGETFAADVVVIGIGIVPNQEIAARAGLEVADGVTVDQYGRSSDPDIFAAGDVAFHFNPILGRHLRLESWANAQNGAIAVARNMVTEPEPYAELPWFWSDQFDLNLQVAGAPETWDRVVTRGDPAGGRCVIFYMAGDRVVGATTFNQGREMRACRQLIEGAKSVADADLADEGTRLRDLVRA